jgi:ubiquitin
MKDLLLILAAAAVLGLAPARAAEDCAPGYKTAAGTCRLQTPGNATATAAGGWTCNRGYYDAGGMCLRVSVPANARPSPQGHSWTCDPGFYESDRACKPGETPPRTFATVNRGLACNLGYHAYDVGCIPDEIPHNARRITDSGLWLCKAGFQDVGDRCIPVEIPQHARLGSGRDAWVCNWGYRPLHNTCVEIDVPHNASLGFYGDVWSCDRGFYEIRGVCLPDDKAHRALVASNADMLRADVRDASVPLSSQARTNGHVKGSGRTLGMVAGVGFILGCFFIFMLREPPARYAATYKMTYIPRPRGSGLALTWRSFGNRIDALTGGPIAPSADVAQCRNCRAWYHAESAQTLRRENDARCVACGRAAVSAIA